MMWTRIFIIMYMLVRLLITINYITHPVHLVVKPVEIGSIIII